jgi:hypothetical protein
MFRCPKCKYEQSSGDGTGGGIPLWPSCGTGSTWTLTKCPGCAALFASPNTVIPGGFVPDEVKKDPKVTVCEFEELVRK